ncbi:ankyrin repeat-containing domain protein [Chaetomium sp. MPI-CAGE-AT-0009]|nr:ankyrin repeat-containing domain protein [Chaetomium sp. MPI-CAGE-AT-0009]
MSDPNHQPSAHRARRRHTSNSPRVTRRPRYRPDDWERRKAQIEELYMKEDWTLLETMEEMKNGGFDAEWVVIIVLKSGRLMKPSKNAYKRYFKQWNWTKNRTKQISTPTIEAPDDMDPAAPAAPAASIAPPMPATTSNQHNQLFKELQKNRPFSLFREHRSVNNPMFLAQAAVLSVHLQDHMELAPDQVRRMLADFGPPANQLSSESTPDSSFFFGVLGLISNKALSEQCIERFLDIIMIERFAPKEFLERIFTIDTPTVDAISETLLNHCVRYNPHAFDLLLTVGVSRRHLKGDQLWRLFYAAFDAGTLDLETGKRLLLEFGEPSVEDSPALTDWWPSLDTKTDPIAQDGVLMDRLVEIGAISLDQALSHAVRWNQGSRVSLLLGRGADANCCLVSTKANSYLDITALDCAYIKGFFGVYQLLLEQSASIPADHPTINTMLTTANLGIQALSRYLESNRGSEASFTLALHIAVMYYQAHLDVAIDVLLGCGFSPNTFHHPISTLAHAIPNIDLVGRLVRAGASINHPSVITTASSNPHYFECLGFLISQGMDLAEVGSIGLSVALDNGNEKAFKLLLRAGADVNRKPDPTPYKWAPPLSVAARKGNHEAARSLLYRGANVDIEDNRRWRPIHYAARYADLKLVKLLVKFGADLRDPEDLDVEDEGYISVMESCALRTTLYFSHYPDLSGEVTWRPWSNEDTEIFKYLAEMGADLSSAYVGDSESLRRSPVVANLILSSADNSLLRFALRIGARFDGRFGPVENNYASLTPLQAAAGKANLGMVKELHARGADVNAEPSETGGATALQAACTGEYDAGTRLAVVEYLLDHGADVNADRAIEGETALSAAARGGYVEITICLLKCGANEVGSSWAALYFAVRNGRLDVVQVLLNNGPYVQHGEEPEYDDEIEVAEEKGHWTIANLLRRYAGQPEVELESG